MLTFKQRLMTVAASVTAVTLAVLPVHAFVRDGDDAKTEDSKEEGDRYFAIQGGDIYTGTGEVLRGATLLSKNGKIDQIGYELYLPEGTETLDATGLRLYPGMVALSATANLSQGSFAQGLQLHDFVPHEDNHGICGECGKFYEEIVPGAVDPGEVSTTHLAAEGFRTDFDDSYDPFGGYLIMALGNGITSVQQSNAAIKLKRGEIDGVSLSESTMTSLPWSSSNPSGKADLRDKFRVANNYLVEFRRWEEAGNKDVKEPSKSGVDSRVLSILEGKTMARFTAYEQSDLLGIARLAQQYRFRPVIQGCTEGWIVADELGRAGAYAVVTPRTRRDPQEQLAHPNGSSIENAAILTAAGVQVAIVPANTSIDLGGTAGRDLLSLPLEAGFAIRGGLDERRALEGITVVPARLLGIDHRVGTLEIGKDADVVVTDGDLLHYQTFVQYTVIEGKLAYDKQKEIFYSHIRPRAEVEAVVDPGEEVIEVPEAAEGDEVSEEVEDHDEDAEEVIEEVVEE